MSAMETGNDIAPAAVAFVIPVYNERESLAPLVEEIERYAGPRPHRLYFVDDGSNDGSPDELRALSNRFPFVSVVTLGSHRGKSAALAAGFALVREDVVITMDSDLQDDPSEVPRFLEALAAGADVVCGWKAERSDPAHRRMASRLYNAAVTRLFGLAVHDVNCGFKIMRAEVATALPLTRGMHRLIPVLAALRGYTVVEIPVTHRPRRYGKSKYGIGRYVEGAWDVLALWFRVRLRGGAP